MQDTKQQQRAEAVGGGGDVGEEPGCWRPTRRSPTKLPATANNKIPPAPAKPPVSPPKSSIAKELFGGKKKPVIKVLENLFFNLIMLSKIKMKIP